MKFTIQIAPMGAVRMTAGMVKRIKYNLYTPGEPKTERVIRYLAYKEELSWIARSRFKGEPLTGPIYLTIIFHMQMPMKWSLKKKMLMEGKHHTNKPDRDNLEKGVMDAFNKIVWKDDGQVCDGPIKKYYSREPRIEIELEEME